MDTDQAGEGGTGRDEKGQESCSSAGRASAGSRSWADGWEQGGPRGPAGRPVITLIGEKG